MNSQASSLTLDRLQTAVSGDAAAIRFKQKLDPAGGAGAKVFPPTYAGGIYAKEKRWIGDKEVPCVLLDSVQSQANRLEDALLTAFDEGDLQLPILRVHFADKLPGVIDVTSLDAPHRIADAIFRDSLLKGEAFRSSPEGKAFEAASVRNATALFELCPTALVFGTWDSTGSAGGLGNKFARALVSEIVAINAVVGVKTSSRIDPLQIEKCPLFESVDGGWTADVDKAKMQGKEPILYKKRKSDKGRPSEINHGNVTPDINRNDRNEDITGGVTMSHAEHTAVLSLTALRRLRFPDRNGNGKQNRAVAARTALAALGLAAIALQHERAKYFLRSGCELIPEHKALSLELIESQDHVENRGLTAKDAVDLFAAAVAAAKDAGLPWRTDPIELEPSEALVSLVRVSRQIAMTEGDQ